MFLLLQRLMEDYNITSVGNNHMGGKDLDRLLYEKVIVPKLENEYDLKDGLN